MPPFNHTKIVVTMGPACWSQEGIRDLWDAGADVFRINMSHSNPEQALPIIQRIRAVSDQAAVLVDTRGPELRTTDVAEDFDLLEGARISIVAGVENELTTPSKIAVKHPDLPLRLSRGVRVYLNDGLMRLVVEEVAKSGQSATCLVERGGRMSSRRGVNVPGVNVFPAQMTEPDIAAIKMAASENVDFLAASFVQTAADVRRIQSLLLEAGAATQVISKIETRKAVDHLQEILEVSSGIMVARGDLGVEIPPEEVPLVQKAIIRECNRLGKPVIVATQMLESMMNHPIATRAETNDVANAVIDGTDAVMLSGETAKGRYPVESVQTLVRVSDHVERAADLFRKNLWEAPSSGRADFVSKAVCRAATDLQVDYIVALTSSGTTARLVSRYKPPAPILAVTPNAQVARQLGLTYGVRPYVIPRSGTFADVMAGALHHLVDLGVLRPTDRIVTTLGLPMDRPGSTNFLGCDTVQHLLEGLTRVVTP